MVYKPKKMKKVFYLIIVITIALFSTKSIAQSTVYWKTFTPANSKISSPAINSITIDPQGTYWLGTDTGISKFDGASTFTKYTTKDGLANNTVNTIAVDSVGNKWIGTDFGVSKFDGNTSWTTYNTTNSPITDNAINKIAVDPKGVVWIGTDVGGIFTVKDTSWTNYNTSNSGISCNTINDIIFDNLGNTWIATDCGGISKLDSTQTVWTRFDSSNSGLKCNNTINVIKIDAKGIKWIGTDNKGVYKFNDTTWVNYSPSQTSSPFNKITDTTIHSIGIDTAGNIWFGTDVKGLKVLDYTLSKVTTYSTTTTAKGLPANKIGCMAFDVARNLKWFGPGSVGFTEMYLGWPVPITLSNFDGVVENKTTILNWISETETNSKAFEIERSNNGKDFNAIGNVSATNLTTGFHYSFTDKLPLIGNNFYRLKMIDIDGQFTYSNTILINNFNSKDKILIYPNPAKNIITIETSTNGILNIYNCKGEKVISTITKNNFTTLDISKLPVGTYFCKNINGSTSFIKE